MAAHFQFDIRSNIDKWRSELDGRVAKQIPFATMLALNKTAEDVRAQHVSMLPGIFDRPTRYTLNSLMIQRATMQRLVSSVYFKQSNRARQHYLVPQVEGGRRAHKAFEYWLIKRGLMLESEYAVPASGMSLDASGNIRAGVITSILSQLAAGPDPFQWETPKSRARAKTSRTRYFVPRLGSNLKRGVWKRDGRGKLSPVLIFVSGVSYQKRYPFEQISRTSVMSNFARRFDAAMLAALLTAKP